MKKKIFRWIKIFTLLYCTAGIALYYAQDSILFHPTAVDRQSKYDFGDLNTRYEEVNIPYDKESNLNIIQFKPARDTAGRGDTAARGVVLYFHGNKKNISRYARHASCFTDKGYEVWMLDYPGYGKSTGKLTEQKLYDYALVFYKLARSRYRPSQIILYGKSLGTAIAAELAAVRDCRRLILEAPYYSLSSLASHYLPIYPIRSMLHYRFPTNEYLPSVTAPITIFHGNRDGIIPYSQAQRLQPLLKPGDEFITIDGGSHNRLGDFPLFRRKLDSLLEH